MSKVFDFPTKQNKRQYHILVPENQFKSLIQHLVKMSVYHGRIQGFVIGIVMANVINLIIQFVFNHRIGN